MSPDSNRIGEFPDDGNLWRLSWAGPIRPNPSVPSEAQVYVVLAGLKDHPQDPFNNSALNNKYWPCWVGIGKIPLLELGSLWRNRERDFSTTLPKPDHLRFEQNTGVAVDLRKLRAGAAPIFARKYWRLGPEMADFEASEVVAFENGGDPFGILVPSYVLFHCYYGTSTRLAKGIVMGTLDEYVNLKSSYLGEDGIAFVHLRLRGKEADAWTIARIMSSDPMWVSVLQARKRFQAASINGKPMEFGFNLPFDGTANWQARVRWIPNGAGGWRALVLNIERCDAHFGFKDVTIHSDRDNRQGENKDDPNLPPAWAGEWATSDPSDIPDEHQDVEEPDDDVKPAEFESPIARFPFLEGKKLRKDPKELQKSRSAGKIKTQREDYEGLGAGDGTSGESDQHPNNVTDGPITVPVPQTLESFMEALKVLAKHQGIKVSMRTIMGKSQCMDDDWAITWFPGYLSKKRVAWSFVGEDFASPRRLAIAEVCRDGRFGYLMEIERRIGDKFSTLVLCQHDGAALTNAGIFRIAILTATRPGWPEESQLPGCRIDRKSHFKDKTAAECAASFMGSLKPLGLSEVSVDRGSAISDRR